MASINGISLKKVTTFRGHEGEPCYQGDVYLGKKKIAFWSQDSWGAIVDNVDMEPGYSETLLRKQICNLNADKAIHGTSMAGTPYTIEYDIEKLMTDYLSLVDDEKRFKKAVKAGFKMIVVVTDGFHITYWSLGETFARLSNEKILKQLKEPIAEASSKMFQNQEIKTMIYRSLEDFKVGKEISIDDIRK